MDTELPLRVRVALALGWTEIERIGNCMIPGEPDDYRGRRPGELLVGPTSRSPIPRFDVDWSAGGPLIEEYKIELEYLGGCFWRAYTKGLLAVGVTPLLAVCELLVYLSPGSVL